MHKPKQKRRRRQSRGERGTGRKEEEEEEERGTLCFHPNAQSQPPWRKSPPVPSRPVSVRPVASLSFPRRCAVFTGQRQTTEGGKGEGGGRQYAAPFSTPRCAALFFLALPIVFLCFPDVSWQKRRKVEQSRP
jgi:hypothetical protein